MGSEDRDLSFELENRSVDQGFFLKKSGVVGAEAGGEVVGPVEKEVVVREEIERIPGLETPGMLHDFDVWVDFGEPIPGTGHF